MLFKDFLALLDPTDPLVSEPEPAKTSLSSQDGAALLVANHPTYSHIKSRFDAFCALHPSADYPLLKVLNDMPLRGQFTVSFNRLAILLDHFLSTQPLSQPLSYEIVMLMNCRLCAPVPRVPERIFKCEKLMADASVRLDLYRQDLAHNPQYKMDVLDYVFLCHQANGLALPLQDNFIQHAVPATLLPTLTLSEWPRIAGMYLLDAFQLFPRTTLSLQDQATITTTWPDVALIHFVKTSPPNYFRRWSTELKAKLLSRRPAHSRNIIIAQLSPVGR